MFDKCIIIWISSSSLPKSMPEVLISLLCFTNETIFLLIKPKVKPIFQKITVEHIEKKPSKYRQVYICVNVVFQIKMINVSIIVGPISVPWGGYPEQMLTKISNSVEQ